MHTINANTVHADDALVARFEGIPSAIISDVTGSVGRAMASRIKPAYRGAEMAGTALTVKATPGDNLIIHKAITMARPGDVLIIDGDDYVETAYLGELMCASCKANDVAGIVVDGAVRDREEITEMRFPVYASGVHPRGPLKQGPGSINVTVSCGGVTVDPGDIVVADDEGVVVVPPNEAESVLERAREKIEAEAKLLARVENGEYLYEIGGYDEIFNSLNVVDPEEPIQ